MVCQDDSFRLRHEIYVSILEKPLDVFVYEIYFQHHLSSLDKCSNFEDQSSDQRNVGSVLFTS